MTCSSPLIYHLYQHYKLIDPIHLSFATHLQQHSHWGLHEERLQSIVWPTCRARCMELHLLPCQLPMCFGNAYRLRKTEDIWRATTSRPLLGWKSSSILTPYFFQIRLNSVDQRLTLHTFPTMITVARDDEHDTGIEVKHGSLSVETRVTTCNIQPVQK